MDNESHPPPTHLKNSPQKAFTGSLSEFLNLYPCVLGHKNWLTCTTLALCMLGGHLANISNETRIYSELKMKILLCSEKSNQEKLRIKTKEKSFPGGILQHPIPIRAVRAAWEQTLSHSWGPLTTRTEARRSPAPRPPFPGTAGREGDQFGDGGRDGNGSREKWSSDRWKWREILCRKDCKWLKALN